MSALLCSPKINKDTVDATGISPLIAASVLGHASIAEALMAAGAQIHFRQARTSLSALDIAAQFGRVEVIAAILRRDPDVRRHVEINVDTPMHTAAYWNQVGSLVALVDNGFNVDVPGARLMRCLHVAVGESCLIAVLTLLRRGANVNARDFEGNTALHHACSHKIRGVDVFVDLLLRWGASETLANSSGRSPADMIQEADLSAERPESQAEQERARALVARAPTDRVWRRRCWVVMLRARVERVGTADLAGSRSADAEDRDGGGRLKVARADDGDRGSAVGGRGPRAGNDDETAAATESFGGLVTALIGLRPPGVFRVVVGFV